MAREFTAVGFFARWIFALALVAATYNPTQYSFVQWAMNEATVFGPIIALAGLVLLICWLIFLRATFRSLGVLGIALGAALFGCFVWLLVDLGWLDMESTQALTWVALVLVSLILAVGLSWSHVRRRLSGQFDVDETDD
ncbi:MAG: DUF6524 family protein [Halioglobus sp.]